MIKIIDTFAQINNLFEDGKFILDKWKEYMNSIYDNTANKGVLTKAPIYAVERIKAIQKVGFVKSEHLLIGKTGYAYDGYWTIK